MNYLHINIVNNIIESCGTKTDNVRNNVYRAHCTILWIKWNEESLICPTASLNIWMDYLHINIVNNIIESGGTKTDNVRNNVYRAHCTILWIKWNEES